MTCLIMLTSYLVKLQMMFAIKEYSWTTSVFLQEKRLYKSTPSKLRGSHLVALLRSNVIVAVVYHDRDRKTSWSKWEDDVTPKHH